ncbi:DEAD/DEAH box helicase [Aromatoleum toluolicum]|uniref:Helicase SNF n=1 Tax=Aromatoleum toluolicum TaxID=90060 RepID=A0ABX1NAD6_9RHOO|nr:DEAD/DEAH box helicase [Aromatoleum toluolicum]NMF96241.1 DEAD/DEAH box helicase [Aromatoleum toluolicum]
MSILDTCTETDITRWLGAHEVAKGRAYLGAVSDLARDGETLRARVQGTRSRPYQVVVQFAGAPHPRSPRLVSYCSCPVGIDCKHVAATLLRWLTVRASDPSRPREQILAWIEAFRGITAQQPPATRKPAPTVQHTLLYLIRFHNGYQQYAVTCFKARLGRNGSVRQAESWQNIERALDTPPSFVNDADLEILGLLWSQRLRGRFFQDALPLDGRNAEQLMTRLAHCGRAYFDELGAAPLSLGDARPGSPQWLSTADGRRAPELRLTPPAEVVLPLLPPWYVDCKANETGPITLDAPAEHVVRLLWLPPLTPVEAEMISATLAELAPALPLPSTLGESPLELSGPPVPVLRIDTLYVYDVNFRSYPRYGATLFDYATLAFRYGPLTIPPGDAPMFHTLPDGRSARLQRDTKAESAAIRRLGQAGLGKVGLRSVSSTYDTLPGHAFGLASEDAWGPFTANEIPALRAEGWAIELPPDFRHHAIDVTDVTLDVDETDGGWLDISPGIEVDGRTLALAPLLAELFGRDTRWLGGGLQRIADAEAIILHHDDLGRLRIAAGRLKPLVGALVDLFDRPEGALRVSRLDAARLADLDLPGRGRDALAELARRLHDARGIQPVATPADFNAVLRPYQLEGLAWLQHLVRHDLAGILADDMGLGKTAQALAHLLTEKHAGRLDRPALVILPTSLVFNWQAEAARFTPGLRVLNLHGPDRHSRFEQLDGVDVALTTYPLLWRDADALQAREWSLLILDEAQTVKNAASKGAQVIRQLRARHRLGLTGTPLENHLGELWAQFDFLLPGFLGTSKDFTRIWRTPVEKRADTQRRDLLAARIKPFMLRRRKEDVAKELPPKTVIVRSIGLEGGQRDLYETVRAAMDDKIRSEIAAKGFARSQIVILDALLKLRQVCCDPRLLKSTAAAARVKERAKLDHLMDMLPELIAEGRRILVFSQFTQMLALIAAELDRARISWVGLTGDTRDRRTPVEDFQRGRASVFLISLKAGGVGLNLTAADTVIHYDPWWNPAAENQATDRAHRIGQDKPVFVFKLICAGSIEERILALQERKAALAAGVLSEDANALAKFGADDIAALLAPLPAATA